MCIRDSFWVGPLSARRAGDLLRQLGRRMALDVGHMSKTEAYRLTRGHPSLSRLFGSHLARLTPRGADPAQNDPTDGIVNQASQRFSRSAEAKAWVAEIESLLSKHHPDAFQLLRDLCAPAPFGTTWAAHRDTEAADLLASFGLVDAETGEPPGLLRDRQQPRRALRPAA